MTLTWAIVATVFAVLFFSAAVLGAGTREDIRAERESYKACYRAARWLAQWNHARAAAMQDALALKLNISYAAVKRLVEQQMLKQPHYGSIGQVVPLDQVPATLKDDAAVYNRRIMSEWPAEYATRARGIEGICQARISQLEDALEVLTRFSTEQELEDVAGSTGVPLPHVRVVALALRSRAEYSVNRITGSVGEVTAPLDPEDVLPSIY